MKNKITVLGDGCSKDKLALIKSEMRFALGDNLKEDLTFYLGEPANTKQNRIHTVVCNYGIHVFKHNIYSKPNITIGEKIEQAVTEIWVDLVEYIKGVNNEAELFQTKSIC